VIFTLQKDEDPEIFVNMHQKQGLFCVKYAENNILAFFLKGKVL
jgi:hypothetical protein